MEGEGIFVGTAFGGGLVVKKKGGKKVKRHGKKKPNPRAKKKDRE